MRRTQFDDVLQKVEPHDCLGTGREDNIGRRRHRRQRVVGGRARILFPSVREDAISAKDIATAALQSDLESARNLLYPRGDLESTQQPRAERGFDLGSENTIPKAFIQF